MSIFSNRIKRSTNELDNLLNDIISSDEIPFHIAADREKFSNAPLLQYLLLRSSSKTQKKQK